MSMTKEDEQEQIDSSSQKENKPMNQGFEEFVRPNKGPQPPLEERKRRIQPSANFLTGDDEKVIKEESKDDRQFIDGDKNSKFLEDQDGKKRICRAVMESEAEQERLADIEDSDPRFLHTVKTNEGTNPDRKFFKNTSGAHLM